MRNKKVPFKFRTYLSLTKRHLLVYLKNPIQVFFTLMVPISILLVYALFLRPMEIQQINEILKSFGIDPTTKINEEFLGQIISIPLSRKIYGIADNWMISGVIAVSCITVSFNTCNVMVDDKESGVSKDFVSSPISSSTIMLSYFTFNALITFITNLLVYFGCLIYLVMYGAYMISIVDFFLIIAVIFLSVVSASLITFFICSFIKTNSTLSTLIATISAGVGFLIGAYLPSSMMPFKAIQYLTTFFPGTYSAGLLRNYFMSVPIEKLTTAIQQNYSNNADALHFVNTLQEQFSFNIDFFGMTVPPSIMYLVILAFIGIFLFLNIFFSSKALLNLPRNIKKVVSNSKTNIQESIYYQALTSNLPVNKKKDYENK